MLLRSAAPDDLPGLRALERAAGEPFRALGMTEIADDEPPALAVLARSQEAGRLLVACVGAATGGGPEAAGQGGRPGADPPSVAGYLMWEPVDGGTHIEQVSVHPHHARRGIGRALIDRAGRDGGAAALTLTTFADVPWNAPYYARLGFRVLDEDALTPGLRAIRAHEAALGLDRWPRVCMRREAAA